MISILLIFVYDRKIISAREENKSSKRNCGPSLEMESRAKASLTVHCLDLSDRKKKFSLGKVMRETSSFNSQ